MSTMTRVGVADVTVPWGDNPDRAPEHYPGVLIGLYERQRPDGAYEGTEARMLPDRAREFAQRILHFADQAEGNGG